MGLAILSPLLITVALAVRLSGPGPVLFRHERVGRRGLRFRICKFRTMVPEAPQRGGSVTVGGDARVTPLGAVLRRTKIDELPQLLNVLKGEMSLVGPRPEVPEYVEMYREQYAPILEVRPGITHRVTLIFRDEEGLLARADDPERYYRERVMPHKIAMYRQDLGHESVLEDVGTIVGTILAVARRGGRKPARAAARTAARPAAAAARLAPVASRAADS